jgi:hypothetical protein
MHRNAKHAPQRSGISQARRSTLLAPGKFGAVTAGSRSLILSQTLDDDIASLPAWKPGAVPQKKVRARRAGKTAKVGG